MLNPTSNFTFINKTTTTATKKLFQFQFFFCFYRNFCFNFEFRSYMRSVYFKQDIRSICKSHFLNNNKQENYSECITCNSVFYLIFLGYVITSQTNVFSSQLLFPLFCYIYTYILGGDLAIGKCMLFNFILYKLQIIHYQYLFGKWRFPRFATTGTFLLCLLFFLFFLVTLLCLFKWEYLVGNCTLSSFCGEAKIILSYLSINYN